VVFVAVELRAAVAVDSEVIAVAVVVVVFFAVAVVVADKFSADAEVKTDGGGLLHFLTPRRRSGGSRK